MKYTTFLLLAGVSASIGNQTIAQTNDRWTLDQVIHGTGQYDFAASEIQPVGDVDGDGLDDILLGSALTPDPSRALGSVMVYSGATHQLLHRFNGHTHKEGQGTAVLGLGDVDGDGHADFLSSSPGIGRVRLYSGATGLRIYRIDQAGTDSFGSSLAKLPDWDGDGIAEFAVGDPNRFHPMIGASGAIEIRSGGTGDLIHTINPQPQYWGLGRTLKSCGDLNGDGQPDLISAASWADQWKCVAYSGTTGAKIRQFGMAESLTNNYFELTDGGDMNGDGFTDILASVPYATIQGMPQAGAVYLHSGANGHTMSEMSGSFPYHQFGAAVIGNQDLNGDGWNDVFISVTGGGLMPSLLQGFSGRSGDMLGYYMGWDPLDQLGESMGVVGDTDGDGHDDIVVTAPYTTDPMTGVPIGSLYIATRQ